MIPLLFLFRRNPFQNLIHSSELLIATDLLHRFRLFLFKDDKVLDYVEEISLVQYTGNQHLLLCRALREIIFFDHFEFEHLLN